MRKRTLAPCLTAARAMAPSLQLILFDAGSGEVQWHAGVPASTPTAAAAAARTHAASLAIASAFLPPAPPGPSALATHTDVAVGAAPAAGDGAGGPLLAVRVAGGGAVDAARLAAAVTKAAAVLGGGGSRSAEEALDCFWGAVFGSLMRGGGSAAGVVRAFRALLEMGGGGDGVDAARSARLRERLVKGATGAAARVGGVAVFDGDGRVIAADGVSSSNAGALAWYYLCVLQRAESNGGGEETNRGRWAWWSLKASRRRLFVLVCEAKDGYALQLAGGRTAQARSQGDFEVAVGAEAEAEVDVVRGNVDRIFADFEDG